MRKMAEDTPEQDCGVSGECFRPEKRTMKLWLHKLTQSNNRELHLNADDFNTKIQSGDLFQIYRFGTLATLRLLKLICKFPAAPTSRTASARSCSTSPCRWAIMMLRVRTAG